MLRKGGGARGAGGKILTKKAAKQAGEQMKNVEHMKRVGSQSSSAARASSALPGVCVSEREGEFVCDYLCVCVRACAHLHGDTSCVCDYVCALPGACASNLCMSMYVYEYVWVRVRICMRMCMSMSMVMYCAWPSVSMYVYVSVSVSMCVYVCVYVRMPMNVCRLLTNVLV